jgi:YcxB-like protein
LHTINAIQYLCFMTSQYFTYNKPKVIQALRYHFITRREIKIMMILVNVFAIVSAALFFFKKVSPLSFLVSSVLWFVLMIVFWFLLPQMIYKKSPTFQDRLQAILTAGEFRIENEKGGRSWPWADFSTWMESPHFFHLYFNSRSFFIVPKDAFDGDEVHEARKILKAKIVKG